MNHVLNEYRLHWSPKWRNPIIFSNQLTIITTYTFFFFFSIVWYYFYIENNKMSTYLPHNLLTNIYLIYTITTVQQI